MLVDIHSHILPGIDDGSQDMQESLEMLQIAAQDGIDAIAATPHVISGVYDNTREHILSAVQELNKQISTENIPIKILPGAEVRLEPDLPQRLERKELLTLNDTGRYLLVELPTAFIPDYTSSVLYELQLKGITPVIAHPERNAGFNKNPASLTALVSRGALAQLTTGSIMGLFGSEIKKTAHKFIKQGSVHVVASDAHSIRGRRLPTISPAFEMVKKQFGQETAEILAYENPARIIAGDNIIEVTPQKHNFLKNLMNKRKEFNRR